MQKPHIQQEITEKPTRDTKC